MESLDAYLAMHSHHPLHSLQPKNIVELKPSECTELMGELDDSMTWFYQFTASLHGHDESNVFMKISSSPTALTEMNLMEQIDAEACLCLKLKDSFFFAGKDGLTLYFLIYEEITETLDQMIDGLRHTGKRLAENELLEAWYSMITGFS